ncbi:hypothetical protein FDG96_gp41 [Bacillus phage Mgbh1]|uniref:Uncharacterized protein n=1 Tax=Bacillus phage Mgbh1 TaxID=1796993 RepID=A0A142F1P3_9CAUD|nr:hypothetical protein FDG96_gp41 [Bacillus phage Mgbh1]AMQ66700.1 hypothetical protein [Bacillus phage Mgbh1]
MEEGDFIRVSEEWVKSGGLSEERYREIKDMIFRIVEITFAFKQTWGSIASVDGRIEATVPLAFFEKVECWGHPDLINLALDTKDEDWFYEILGGNKEDGQ